MMSAVKLLFAMAFLCLQVLRFEGEATVIPALEEESARTDLALKDEAPQRRAFQRFVDLVKRGKLHQFYGLMGKRARETTQNWASDQLLPAWAS